MTGSPRPGHQGLVQHATAGIGPTGPPRAAPHPVPPFDELYEEHFAFVWRSLRRLGVPDRGLDDAVQELFLVVHRRLHEFEGRSSLRTWLFGIALNVARRARRTERRRGADELPESLPDPTGRTPHDEASRAQAVRALHELLEGLDEDKRTCFVLIELEQLSAPEVAAELGLSVNTVYSRLRAARRDFEDGLARHRARDRWRQP